MIQPADIARSELIGVEVEIVDAENKSLIGLKGPIVDETKNTLTLEIGKETKKIVKSQVKLKMKMDDKTFQIDGKILVGRPEDRLKKLRRIK